MAGVEQFLKKPATTTRLGNVQFVRKRDGFIEPFDIEKLDGWAEWACQKTDTADWKQIVRSALRFTSKSTIDSDDLQDLLIRSAESLVKMNPEFDIAARELYLARLRKSVYDSFEPPSLRGWASHLMDLGVWEDMPWIPDHYWVHLEEAIDHTRDHKFSYSGLKQFADKYARRNIHTDEIYETPQFTYMGMAMAIARTGDWSLTEIIELYNAFSLHKINVPTPPLVGLRTPDKGFASCCLMEAADTLDSIDAAEHIVFKMVAARAGIGYLLRSRATGDPIRNGSFVSTGKIPYLRHALISTQANTQQTRGGSMTANVPFFDAEVLKIIASKSQRSAAEDRLDKSDFLIQFNGLVLERAIKGQNITLMSIYYAPEVFDAFVDPSGDIEHFKKVYEAAEKRLIGKTKIGKGGSQIPVVEVIPAAELLSTAIAVRMETGRLYFQFMDNTNAHSNFDEPIKMSNLCVSGDTKILTDIGEESIINLVGKETTIWNGQEWSVVTPAKTGSNQELLQITFSDGSVIKATPYHKFYHSPARRMASRCKTVKDKLEEVRAKDLEVGVHRMPKFELPVIQGNKVLEYPYTNGFFTGDGTYHKNRNGSLVPKIYLYGKKVELLSNFEANLVGSGEKDSSDRLSYLVRSSIMDKFFVPNAEYTLKSRIDWLRGIFDADGCVQYNGSTVSIVLSSNDKEFLKSVRELLRAHGVHSKFSTSLEPRDTVFKEGQKAYHCKEIHRITIGATGTWKLIDQGLTLANLDIDKISRPNRDATQFITVTKIEEIGREDTYCFTEPKLNLGVFNGILAGNCVEINQPTYPFKHVVDLYKTPEQLKDSKPGEEGEVSLCNLGGFVLGSCQPWEKERIYYILLKFVDSIIEIQDYTFPAMEFSAKARRNVGIGVMNAAGAMAKEGLQFEGMKARNWMHKQMEDHAYYLHKASVQLAKERGKAKWFDYTAPASGVLVVDTYKKTVDDLVSVGLQHDWEELRADILKYGMRNSVLTAQMPGESSSVVLGVSNSINPIRDIVVIKKSGINMVPQVAYGVTTGEVDESVYKYAFDIDKIEWIKFVAVVQKWFSQSISADQWYVYDDYEKGKIPVTEVVKHMILAHKYGWKSMYYAWFDAGNGGSSHDTESQSCSSGGCTL